MDKKFLAELKEYVALPSVSADPKNAKDCVRTAQWVAAKLKKIGFSSKLVKTGGHPLVMATYNNQNQKQDSKNLKNKIPHVVVYGHYDVQPADPIKLWKTLPFTMIEKNGKIFGRGTSDNKGPTLALLYGLEAALKNIKLNKNIKITCLIEGEEEMHSQNLTPALVKLKKELGHVDIIVLSDTASLSDTQLCVTTGVRGLAAMDLTIRGLARDLHSGNGGAIPNAVRELSRVLASLHDAQGWVAIPGFYAGITPPSKAELASVKKALNTKEFAKEIGAKDYYPVGGKSPFDLRYFYPSFEVNGILGGYQGPGSKTIIPAEATAKITCRLAAGQSPAKVIAAIQKAIKSRVNTKLFDYQLTIHGAGNPAYAVPMDGGNPVLKKALAAIDASAKEVTGKKPFYLREGGSIGILADFKKILGADSVMLGLFNEDSLLHSPNENVRLKLLENGIKVWQRFFEALG